MPPLPPLVRAVLANDRLRRSSCLLVAHHVAELFAADLLDDDLEAVVEVKRLALECSTGLQAAAVRRALDQLEAAQCLTFIGRTTLGVRQYQLGPTALRFTARGGPVGGPRPGPMTRSAA